MQTVLGALLMLAAPIADTSATHSSREPVVEEQPLEAPTFALIHTNDTRGYLEACG